MERAEFEEKQYEQCLASEIAAGSTAVFFSGQVLEAILGYDLAVFPGDPAFWMQLGQPAPLGLVLTPELWRIGARPAPQRLPSRLVSLILQVKRPQRLSHWRAAQYHRWKGPYFRFYVNDPPGQLEVLDDLETATHKLALVRYAAAAFVSYGDLLSHQEARRVTRYSAFVAPNALRGHRLWSYDAPGTSGFANPEGEDAPGDSIETLLESARELAAARTLGEHVRALAGSLDTVDRSFDRWVEGLEPFLLAGDPETREYRLTLARAWGAVAAAVARTGATWLVLGFE